MKADIQLETVAVPAQIVILHSEDGAMTTFSQTSLFMNVGKLFSVLARRRARTEQARNADLLDIRDLSDHLKRDMGFLDGNGTGRRRH